MSPVTVFLMMPLWTATDHLPVLKPLLRVPVMSVDTVWPFLAGKGGKLKEAIETRSEGDAQFLNGTSLAGSSIVTFSK